jgi:hypothetical protein
MWRVLCKIQIPQASSKTQYNTYVLPSDISPSDIFYGKADMSVYRLRRETSQVRLLRCRLQTKVSVFMGNDDCICLTPLFPETCCESTSRLAPHAWRQGRRCQRKLSRASQSSLATTAPHSRKLATRSYPV